MPAMQLQWDRIGFWMMIVFGVGILGALGLALYDMTQN